MSKYAFRLDPSTHAELNASSAERWMTCPGSVALSAGIPNRSSEFAAEGTAAHYIGSTCLNERRLPTEWLGKEAMVEGYRIKLDAELIDAVQEYLDDITTYRLPGDIEFVEQSFTAALKKLHSKFGGSGDYVNWRPSTRHLRVEDYKHGAGVPVDVDDNKQLKIYALGALLTNSDFNAETVEIRIAQPRCDHEQGRFRSYTFPAFELLDFAADLIDAAKRTEEFGADLVPSKKACKWCPAAAARKCPKIEQELHAVTISAFDMIADPAKYSLAQIAEFLTKAPLVEQAISSMREFAYQRACAGEDIPGFKIVAKRATRKWKNEEEAVKYFAMNRAVFTEPELRSPAQVEKILGKKKFEKVADEYVEKISSGHTLVLSSDPRPPAAVAQLSDFGVVGGNAEAQ